MKKINKNKKKQLLNVHYLQQLLNNRKDCCYAIFTLKNTVVVEASFHEQININILYYIFTA